MHIFIKKVLIILIEYTTHANLGVQTPLQLNFFFFFQIYGIWYHSKFLKRYMTGLDPVLGRSDPGPPFDS